VSGIEEDEDADSKDEAGRQFDTDLEGDFDPESDKEDARDMNMNIRD